MASQVIGGPTTSLGDSLIFSATFDKEINIYNKHLKNAWIIFKALLKRRPLEKDCCGGTALYWAAITGKLTFMKYLLEVYTIYTIVTPV